MRIIIALVAPLIFFLLILPNLGAYKAYADDKAHTAHIAHPGTKNRPLAFTSPLAIPTVLTDANITLEAREADIPILSGALPHMWTYNGAFPGPTIHQVAGQTTHVTLVNHLPAAGTLTLHQHGAHTDTISDGQPMEYLVDLDASRTYTYAGVEDGANIRGSMHWYHDHMMDVTGQNVWMGLAGMYIVDDPADPQTLPSGEFDVPLMLMDRQFDENNQLVYQFDQNGVQGDTMLANGVVQPYFDVAARKYRLRILNASNFSDIELVLSNGQSMVQVGTESGLLPAPVSRQSILLGPAERADIVVDFTGLLGQNIVLLNNAGSGSTAQIMQFRVTHSEADPSSVPATLRPLPNLGTPVAARTFVFGHTNGRWTINGQTYDVNRVDAQPLLGTTERWILQNPLPNQWTHVVHIHLSNQQFISKNGAPPAPYELMKESWYLAPGDTIELLLKFSDYTGRFVFHCHLLEHEDDSMMTQFEVVSSLPPPSPTPSTTATSTATRTATRTVTNTPAQTVSVTATPNCVPATPTTQGISIVNFAFNPQTTTISQGSTVVWTNTSNRTHTSASDNGVWNSGNIGAGQTFSRVFNTVGAFPYHCNIHPQMTGTINVVAGPCATNTPAPTNIPSITPTSSRTSTSTSIATSTTAPTAPPTAIPTSTAISATATRSPTPGLCRLVAHP